MLREGSLQETSFGSYQLIELLGRGGMGEVWRAHDTVIDRTVAIKILPADISKDPIFQQRFRREAHAAARLNSPHVVPIHTHGEFDGRLFVDMRLIEGRNLDAILDNGPLPPARAVNVVDQIAKALNAAHKVGLLHRDVKPSNILLDEDDYAYLIDFGIALAEGERGLTTVGNVIGTFHYMAPERFKPDEPGTPPVDARSDIYALACVLYECLTAAKPFPGDSLEQQIGNHLVSPPPQPSKIIPGLPRVFDDVVAKGMAKNPADRYEKATDLARAARGAVTTPMPLPRPPAGRPNLPARTPPPPTTTDEIPRQGPPPRPGAGAETLQQQVPSMNSYGRREAVVRPETVVEHPSAPIPTPQPGQPAGPAMSAPPARPSLPWWRTKKTVITATALLAIVAIVVTVMATLGKNGSGAPAVSAKQSTLPFTDLNKPEGVTYDNATGTVYVADTGHNRILALSQGKQSTMTGFTDLSAPSGVTTDSQGTLYVNDVGHNRVVYIPPNSTKQVTLLTDLGHPTGLSVTADHNIYVTDTATNKVLHYPPGSTKPVPVRFPDDLKAPTGLVVRPDGTILVADGGNDRVLSLSPSGSWSKLPFTDLKDPGGLTVDKDGNVYVTSSEGDKVLELPAHSDKQVVLPFSGLQTPWGLAVDKDGTVYVANRDNKIVALQQ
jgi:serine/threonine protein kinase, bacterial